MYGVFFPSKQLVSSFFRLEFEISFRFSSSASIPWTSLTDWDKANDSWYTVKREKLQEELNEAIELARVELQLDPEVRVLWNHNKDEDEESSHESPAEEPEMQEEQIKSSRPVAEKKPRKKSGGGGGGCIQVHRFIPSRKSSQQQGKIVVAKHLPSMSQEAMDALDAAHIQMDHPVEKKYSEKPSSEKKSRADDVVVPRKRGVTRSTKAVPQMDNEGKKPRVTRSTESVKEVDENKKKRRSSRHLTLNEGDSEKVDEQKKRRSSRRLSLNEGESEKADEGKQREQKKPRVGRGRYIKIQAPTAEELAEEAEEEKEPRKVTGGLIYIHEDTEAIERAKQRLERIENAHASVSPIKVESRSAFAARKPRKVTAGGVTGRVGRVIAEEKANSAKSSEGKKRERKRRATRSIDPNEQAEDLEEEADEEKKPRKVTGGVLHCDVELDIELMERRKKLRERLRNASPSPPPIMVESRSPFKAIRPSPIMVESKPKKDTGGVYHFPEGYEIEPMERRKQPKPEAKREEKRRASRSRVIRPSRVIAEQVEEKTSRSDSKKPSEGTEEEAVKEKHESMKKPGPKCKASPVEGKKRQKVESAQSNLSKRVVKGKYTTEELTHRIASKLIHYHSKPSPHDPSKMLPLLNRLLDMKIAMVWMRDSGLANVVNHLRKSPVTEVATLAKHVRAFLKEQARAEEEAKQRSKSKLRLL